MSAISKKLTKGMSLLVVSLLVLAYCPVVLADMNVPKQVEQTDKQIANKVRVAVMQAAKLDPSGKWDDPKAAEKLQTIIAQLQDKTGAKVDNLIIRAEKQGVEVSKVLITVEIGGQTVLVDPCEVLDD